MSQLQFLELPKGAVLPITKINPGLWYWKDDTKTLEFASAYPKEEPKEKFKKGKTIHFQESGSKTLDRSTPSYFRDIFALRNSIRGAEDKSPRPVKRGQNELITLDDVKFAALFLADEDETFHVPSFSIVMRCKQLDGFLMALLYYISFFLEKIALENKPKSFMGKPSVLEKKEMKENRIKLAVTKKHLAEMYCILILGLGMAEQHHMACGKRKISTSQKDRDFFECLYNFSSYVAFVTFKQKNLKEIQQEVGRLLRSNIFNPALRDRTTRKEVIKTDITKEAKKVKFPYCRSADARQPAIRSVMDQRSPVLSTLLPMAKDSAQYLFQNHYLRPGKTSPSYDPEDLPELSSVVTQNKIGIIGTPRSKYNPHTLIPLGIQDEMEEDNESLRTKTSMSSICSRELTASSQRGTQDSGSHTCVAVSRATTEGDYVENPQ
ncbi:protein phosphatase 1 regulatory subunit 36 isoform X1 [Hemicordylus capensis]|uniref:protein phosphatase 1 regulatory subunit 36 isoform X1 n=1 Tax=Hemicordylus capensis TaxID=884348 RepID=UPI002302F6EA|nr:protein phosphatase 1 regulatory subunit 36 isoform X1 [Hemicordylus capensis]